ncbi:TonB-dependent receptor domain-containing protein [Chryseobacterium sp. PTM-20240506]|uniref:TonB-dependent receptor n=1 Tax=unclassified Chryseobacterium TaxID=2593645 RepID=UPI00235A416E|nr:MULTISPECIES: TonB-dependent receptor [unclassified Chryseobacterium]MDC8102972.1 TonB-dependent receptor [Chryseobacterium sp. B21-037]MDQ1802518.1 TonB-dependent receptor [Chryseobacterium sp. CKR4-1]
MIRLFSCIFIGILIFFSTLLPAQDIQRFSLSGTIKSDGTQSLVISLFDAENTLIKTETADRQGQFRFSALKVGRYQLKVYRNGFEVYHSENIPVTENKMLPVIDLTVKSIEEVTITKTRPFIERQEGKMILNVENSISATGSSAFEILEKAPGVSVDNNDNLSLHGKGNLLVQIDGKNTPMTGSDLAGYLRGIPSASIDKIEFVTNPSSKYDAEGSSIINIRLKKEQKKGTNGTVSISAGAGKYIKTNNTVSINHRSGKVNAFANYGFVDRIFYNHLLLNRNFYENNQFKKAFIQDNFLKFGITGHMTRMGIDYDLNNKNILGLSVGLVANNVKIDGNTSSLTLGSNQLPESTFGTISKTRNHFANPSLNLNHKYSLDSLGSELTTDFDYINYSNGSLQNFETRNYNLSGSLDRLDILKGDMKGKLNIFSLKSDLTKNFKYGWKLESGIKTSFVKSDNDLKFFDGSSGVFVSDPTKTNHFIYEENINAVYGNASKKWERLKMIAGLRMENTNIKGMQLANNQINKRNYTQVFPSAVLAYNITDKSSMEISLSRRITRPSYNQLNPFRFYFDPTTSKAGNPDLIPETMMNYELTYSLNNKYFATLNYSRTSDHIINVVKPVVENGQNIAIQTFENISSASHYGLSLIVPVKVMRWWDISNTASFYYASFTGNVSGSQITNQGNFTFSINSIHNFKLGNGFTAEVTGNYHAREIQAYVYARPYGFLSIGAQKKFNNKSVLKFSFADVFFTSNPRGQFAYNDYLENFTVKRDSRVVMLSYTYNFGSSKNLQLRKTGGADDLKERIGS